MMDEGINEICALNGASTLDMAKMDEKTLLAIKKVFDLYGALKTYMLEYIEHEDELWEMVTKNTVMLKEILTAMNMRKES